MLLQIQPKYNTNLVKSLNEKLKQFIDSKKPTMFKWMINELYFNGISPTALKWRFHKKVNYELQEITDTNGEVTGEKRNIPNLVTLEQELGTYRYNNRGIPTKIKDYLDDITTREIAVDCKSFSMDLNSIEFIKKIITDELIADKDWNSNIYKVIKDQLIKGNGFLMNESFDLVKQVKSYSTHDNGKYKWNKDVSVPYKRGTYTSYIDPECIFTESGTKTPSELFIGTPMTYSELITTFPDLEKLVNKPASINYNSNYQPKDNKINTTKPFNYNLADKIIKMYNNFTDSKNYGNLKMDEGWDTCNSFIEKLQLGDSYYNNFLAEDKFWLWKYYNLKYNPNDDNSGDFFTLFIDNHELYSGPILEMDKELPIVNFAFNPDSKGFFSDSMTDKLKSIQDQINEFSNIKKNQIEWLSTTNITTNRKFIQGNFSLDKHRINVLDIATMEDKGQEGLGPTLEQPMPIGNIIQNFSIGNANAVTLSQQEIDLLLFEMDEMYPKPLSKIQAQPQQAQENTTYSPTTSVNQLINQFTYQLSNIGEKFVKETIQALRYFQIKDKQKELYLYDNVIEVVDNEESKLIKKAIKLFNQYQASVKADQQQQGNQNAKQDLESILNDAQMTQEQKTTATGIYNQKIQNLQNIDLTAGQKPEDVIKDKATAIQVIADMTKKGLEDETIYFTIDTLVLLGSQDLKMHINFNKSRDEIIRDTKQFMVDMQSFGVIIDTSKVGEALAILYGQNLDVLPGNPPDPIVSQLLSKGAIKQNYLYYPDAAATKASMGKFFGLNPNDLQFNSQNGDTQKFLFEQQVLQNVKTTVDSNQINSKAVATTASQQYLNQSQPTNAVMDPAGSIMPNQK